MNPGERESVIPPSSVPADLSPRTPSLQGGTHPLPPRPPNIPDYEVQKRIGGGSYGDVWLARSLLGTYRAVKVVYRGSFEHDEPFEREFKGIQRFEPVSHTHDSQVRILHVGRNVEEGYFYYVMELADDAAADESTQSLKPDSYVPRTLKLDLQRRGRLPVEDCIQIGLSLSTALTHLHSHGLIHRDVKPSNIIFVNGIPKLADIGLVTDVEATRSFVGTEGFIPPDGPGTVQADLYSLGKVLYEMSMGRSRLDFPLLPANWDELPADEQSRLLEFNEVLVKACESEPRQRYQSARELCADLALLQSAKSVRRLRLIERRLAITTKVGLVTAGLLVIAAVAYLFAISQTHRAQDERNNAERLVYAADMSVAQQALEAGNLLRATDLLKSHRPKPGRPDLRGFEWFYLNHLCRGDESHTFHGHRQGVESLAVSPDGKLLASGSDDQTIKLWDLASKMQIGSLEANAGEVNVVAFSPDGTRLASGGTDKSVWIWDLARRRATARFTNHADVVTSLAFSPDGKWLAVGTDGVSARVWDLATGASIREFVTPDNDCLLVAFSPDGKWLANGGNGNLVRLWALPSLQPSAELYEEAGDVNGIAFSPDSKILAATRSDGIYLWDIASHRVVGKIKGHEAEVHPVAFSPDGKMLASGSTDATVRLWDAASGQLLRIFKGHKQIVRSVVFSADGQTLISGSMDHDVKVWELSSKTSTEILRGHSDMVHLLSFSPDDKHLASASLDGTIKLWDVLHGTNIATLSGHTGGVTGVTFSRDGSMLMSCGLDQTVRFWDAKTFLPLKICTAEEKFSCLALSPDGKTLAVGGGWWNEGRQSTPRSVIFWDTPSRQRLTNTLNVHDMVAHLSYSPDGKTLALGMADDSLELVDVNSKTSLFLSTNLGCGVVWSPRDGTLAVVDETEWIGFLDIVTHRISRRIQMPSSAIRYAACSPDGKTMAFFYTTTKIKLCNVTTGREVASLQGHEGFGMYLAFSHDGQTLASADNDRTIHLWRAPRDERSELSSSK